MFFENKGLINTYLYFDVDTKGNNSTNFQNFQEQVKTPGLAWKKIHFNNKTELSNNEKFITKTLKWRKIQWGIRETYKNYNTIFYCIIAIFMNLSIGQNYTSSV